MENNRRDFLKTIGALGMGAAVISPITAMAGSVQEESGVEQPKDAKNSVVSILQTTDVHCQIHPHDELFWEKGKSVFRKTGGYAYVSEILKQQKNINPFYIF